MLLSSASVCIDCVHLNPAVFPPPLFFFYYHSFVLLSSFVALSLLLLSSSLLTAHLVHSSSPAQTEARQSSGPQSSAPLVPEFSLT